MFRRARDEGAPEKPPKFTGDVNKATDWIHQVEMYFHAQPNKYDPAHNNLTQQETDEKKILLMNSLLEDSEKQKGKPRRWATLREKYFLAHGWPTWNNYHDQFLEAFKAPNAANRADRLLETIKSSQFDSDRKSVV